MEEIEFGNSCLRFINFPDTYYVPAFSLFFACNCLNSRFAFVIIIIDLIKICFIDEDGF